MVVKVIKKDHTRNQRQARRREREKSWLKINGWRSWEALHTALMNGTVRLVLWKSDRTKVEGARGEPAPTE
jgi:hypothetical protein